MFFSNISFSFLEVKSLLSLMGFMIGGWAKLMIEGWKLIIGCWA
jgi:hypothetical protein